jgi:ABC-2 type transport system permease protein
VAVRDRQLRPWTGVPTSRRRRFLVLARDRWSDLFSSRLVTVLTALAFAPLLAAAGFIYLRYNLAVLEALKLPLDELVPIDARFFYRGLQVQGTLAFVLAVFVGPGLVSPDLADGALPLILSRPISRAGYVLGKLTVLVGLLSAVSWLPLALLVLFEAGLAPQPGLAGHGRDLAAVVASGVLWVMVVSLLALALSAWVRWRILAGALLVAVLALSRAMGVAATETTGSVWAGLLDLPELVGTVWRSLFFGAPDPGSAELPPVVALAALAALAAVCLLLLGRRLRAFEVVR